MNEEAIVKLVSNVAFPIFACTYLMTKYSRIIHDNNKVITALSASIDKIAETMVRLEERIK